MITPADDFDDGPDLDPDDPLTVILRPPAGHLGPPPGRYEEIRRGAVRRRTLRTAAGVGAACAVTVFAVLLPLRLTASDAPVRPSVPLAPPAVTGGPSTGPLPGPATTPSDSAQRPTRGAADTRAPDTPAARVGTDVPGTDRTLGTGPTPSARDTRSTLPGTRSSTPSPSKARR
ncbi:hypothetical protein GCM10010269_45420 [Streptomyces humidus]|uniref:Uncharacterized protein n=1 Tax=Streptomyces humidus TaxID=52259 RepID=A0A918L4W6_9ACTN|nr:hypothetical protein [Streptomyces humidus]GGS01462.1 hypothetical protein GCM10010269_45420 [Streptomyces humidus]